jgi:hypothetical protein
MNLAVVSGNKVKGAKLGEATITFPTPTILVDRVSQILSSVLYLNIDFLIDEGRLHVDYQYLLDAHLLSSVGKVPDTELKFLLSNPNVENLLDIHEIIQFSGGSLSALYTKEWTVRTVGALKLVEKSYVYNVPANALPGLQEQFTDWKQLVGNPYNANEDTLELII